MNFLILHGIGGHAGIHWQGWLAESLESEGHSVEMPNLPQSNRPSRLEWLEAVKGYAKGKKSLVIIGHSLGVTTALDYIESSPDPVLGLVSVSGFASDTGAELNSYFLRERIIDLAKVRSNLGHAIVFYGNNDPYVSEELLAEVATGLRVEANIVKDGGHLNTDAGFSTFPSLLEAINHEFR